jgi:ABC-type uncharacterized transport system auxiliary subunit
MRRLLLTLLVVLAGCAQPAIPEDHFYRLTLAGPAPGTSVATLPSGTIMVERFAADGLTASRPIVFTDGAGSNVLQTYHYHYWVEPPPVLLQAALADYLRKAGAAQVVTPELRVEPAVTIDGRIRAFEQVRGSAPAVRAQLELAVTERASGRLLLFKTYSAEPRTGGESVAEAARQISAAIDQIYAQFVRDFAGAR